MTPDLVADIGNSRIKWGRCSADTMSATASLPADDPAAWCAQLRTWQLVGPLAWAVCGSGKIDFFRSWLEQRGDAQRLLENRDLPLHIAVDHPEKVGIDRLANAVAARARLVEPGPAIIVDAGSAVTVDWVDNQGVFRGGSIFPGLRLMTRALQQYTARLPLVSIEQPKPPLPATNTRDAIAAGVYWAVVGGIETLIKQLSAQPAGDHSSVFLTGGDAHLLAPALAADVHLWPDMTLEGIRLSARALQ